MLILEIVLNVIHWVCMAIFYGIFLTPLIMLIVWVWGIIDPEAGWKKWLTLEDYWSAYPDCKTPNGTKCFHCGSHHIRQKGYDDYDDWRRIHWCHHCNTPLFRTRL